MFPCLELIIIGCSKLRDLLDSLHTCVSLQKLVVQDCPKLRSLPGVPSITTLPSGVQCYTSLAGQPFLSSRAVYGGLQEFGASANRGNHATPHRIENADDI